MREYKRAWHRAHYVPAPVMPGTRFAKARQQGFRSGLEVEVCKALDARKVNYKYEPFAIPFVPPVKVRRYTPDIVLLDNGIVVELKGRFESADRSKHRMVKAQHPDLDIRLVFSNPNARISKQSKTTYAAWCTTYGFKFAARTIPDSWLHEPPNKKSLAAIAALTSGA